MIVMFRAVAIEINEPSQGDVVSNAFDPSVIRNPQPQMNLFSQLETALKQ